MSRLPAVHILFSDSDLDGLPGPAVKPQLSKEESILIVPKGVTELLHIWCYPLSDSERLSHVTQS